MPALALGLILGAAGLGGPSYAATTAGPVPTEISGGGARPFDPARCLTSDSTGISIGDLLSCALPEPQEGPAAGIPDAGSPTKFTAAPGVDYIPASGTAPELLSLPAGCDSPVYGTWTQDQGLVEQVSRVGDRTIFGVVLNSNWNSGFGEGGRATFRGDLWIDPRGFAVVVGREMFQGTIGGRSGSAVTWTVGNAYPTGRFVAHAVSVGGTEGLSKLRLDADGVGLLGKGGHWVPGHACFTQ